MGSSCSVVRSPAPPPTASYFHTVPPEVARNILRFVSKTPRALRWENGVRIRDAISILKAGGPLGDVARDQFVAVKTSTKHFIFGDDYDEYDVFGAADDDRSTATTIHGITASNVRVFRRLLLQGRPLVQTAHIYVHYNPRAWSRALLMGCADLRTLCLSSMRKQFPVAPVLKVCGPNLQVLEIKSPYLSRSQAAAIGANCVRLKKLRLRCYTAWADIGPLWEGVGNTLEDLALSVVEPLEPGEWVAALNLIRMFCPTIRKLEFDIVAEWQSFTQFCISYGDQLETLKVCEYYPEHAFYNEIVAGCPKVLVDTRIDTDSLVPSVKSLGRHLQTLHIMGYEEAPLDAFDFDAPLLAQVAESCTQLQTIALYPEEIGTSRIVGILQGLLADKKPFLERIEIHERSAEIYNDAPIVPGSTPTTSDILATITNTTTTLRHFVFACYTPNVGLFDTIARKNQHLETVHIILYQCLREIEEIEEENSNNDGLRQAPLEAALEGVVKSFAQCPKLRSLIVADYMGCFSHDMERREREKLKKQLTEYCAKLRHRPILIKILDHTYLQ